MIKFSFDTSGLNDLIKKLSKYEKSSIHKEIGHIIENEVVYMVNTLGLVDSGRFKTSINSRDYNSDRVIIQDGVTYGRYLEYGTRPHMVKPKKAKALHWKQNGVDAFSKGHMVSGIQEYAPFRKGAIVSVPKVESYVLKTLMKEVSA